MCCIQCKIISIDAVCVLLLNANTKVIIELPYFAVAAAAAVTGKTVCWQEDTCIQPVHASNNPWGCKCINAGLPFKRRRMATTSKMHA